MDRAPITGEHHKLHIQVPIQNFVIQCTVFTTLHVMHTRYSDKNSVRLSVRPSHALIVTKRMKDLSRFLYHKKDNLA